MSFLIYFLYVGFLAILSIVRPALGLTALLLMFSFEQWAQASNPYFFKHNWLTNYVFLAIVILAASSSIIKGNRFRIFPDKSVACIALLFSYAFMTIVWTPDASKAIDIWTFNGPFLILMILLVPSLIKSPSDLGSAFYAYLAFGFPLALLLLFTVEWWGRYLVIVGTKSPFDANPNAIGNVGILLMLLAIVLEVDSNKKIAGVIKLNSLWRVLKWIVILAGLALAIKAESRGQILAAVIATFIAIWLKGNQKDLTQIFKMFAIVTSVAIASVLVFGFVIEDQARWTGSKILSDVTLRYDAATTMIEHWSANSFSILFGLGNTAAYDIVGLYPHVIPVEILTELGLVGFSLFIIVIVLTLINIRYILSRTTDRRERSFVLGLMAYFLIELVLSLKQGSLNLSPTLFVPTVIFGHLRLDLQAKPATVPDPLEAEMGPISHSRKRFNIV